MGRCRDFVSPPPSVRMELPRLNLLLEKAREGFGLDLRSLALFRVLLGLTILRDLFMRAEAGGLRAFYTDAGLLPRHLLTERMMPDAHFSIHLMGGEAWQVFLLFLLQAALALLLMVGYRTRLVTFLSWVMMISLHNRNPIILTGADTLLRVALFWSMFLPLGRYFSLDALRLATPVRMQFASIGTLAFILQICLVYWCTVYFKKSDIWWNGEALSYTLQLDQYATRLGLWLRDQTWAHKPGSYLSLYWEALGPFLLFIPFRTGFFRFVAVVGFVLLHLGMWLTMDLGIFPMISIVTWLALLPGIFWEAVRRQFRFVSGEGFERWRLAWGARWHAFNKESWLMQHLQAWPIAIRERLEHRLGQHREDRRSWAGGLLAGFFLLYVIAWNVRGLEYERYVQYFPSRWNVLGQALRLDQKWSMFAPAPQKVDGWFVVEAELRNGAIIDLLTGKPVQWEKPDLVIDTVPNRRWSKYQLRIRTSHKSHLKRYAEYLAREWDSQNAYPRKVKIVKIHFMRELYLGQASTPPHRTTLWTQTIWKPRLPPRGAPVLEGSD